MNNITTGTILTNPLRRAWAERVLDRIEAREKAARGNRPIVEHVQAPQPRSTVDFRDSHRLDWQETWGK